MDIFSLIGAGSTLSLVGLCWNMARDRNGKYIPKDVCEIKHKESQLKVDAVEVKLEATRNILESKIVELKEDVLEIKTDIKELLKR